MASLTLSATAGSVKITEEQWKEYISDTFADQHGELETVGGWSIPVRYKAVATSCTWKNEGYGNFMDTITFYGKRTMHNIKENGYNLAGRVSINGKKRSAYSSSVMLELPDGRLFEIATIRA